jgi:hypothetical protein
MTAEPPEPPAGYHWEPFQEGRRWRLVTGKQCRMRLNRHITCARPAVAEFARQRRLSSGKAIDAWWAYCEEHLYGRWIENGVIMYWKLVEDQSVAR